MKLVGFAGLSTMTLAPAALADSAASAVAQSLVDFVLPTASAQVVPEPSLFALLAAGGVAAGAVQYVKRRRKR